MNDPDFDELWRDTLDEGISPAFAELARAQTLACVRRLRRRRQRRRTGIAGVGGGVLLGALFYLAARFAAPLPVSPTASLTSRPIQHAAAKTSLPPVHFLTDEELLSRFPHRPVALVGPPEQEQLIFLDEPARVAAAGGKN